MTSSRGIGSGDAAVAVPVLVILALLKPLLRDDICGWSCR
jgi:hypothetical protein